MTNMDIRGRDLDHRWLSGGAHSVRRKTRPSPPVNPLRPVQQADTAQAAMFLPILRAEYSEVTALVAAAELRWLPADGGAPAATPEPVARLRQRLEEIRRLIHALQRRFPQPENDGLS